MLVDFRNMIKKIARECANNLGFGGFIHSVKALKNLIEWTSRDQEFLDFYSLFFKSGDLIFDVGANVGTRTKIFLKGGASVIAIEPQIEYIRILRIYRKMVGAHTHLKIEKKALGAKQGYVEFYVCNSSTLSSCSLEWINAVKNSGRFLNYNWSKKRIVEVTTLDRLIDKYGIPSFIKIDVEGFEEEVIKGLKRPIPALCFEFTPEYMRSAIQCIEMLEMLGNFLFNYSLQENPQLELSKWVSASELIEILQSFKIDKKIYGDIYAKLFL